MTNQTQDSLSSPQSSYLEAIYDPFDGSSKLLSTISSANFNGAIPDLIVQYPDATTDDLIPGRFFLITDTYYLITRVDENIDPTTTDTISYNVWYTAGGVERYKTILNGVKIFTDGTELQIRKDDWANKSIGYSGWTITTEGNSVFSNVAVRGTIEATSGYFDGHLYVGDPDDPDSPGGMRIGTNVDGTRENPGTQDGIYINENNYWYDSGLFKIGNSTKNVVWDNNNLSVTGDINATGGEFSGRVKIGNMFIGVNASSTLDGIHINGTNYWYDNGNFSLGTGTSTISFNGSNILFGTGIEISGSISANSLLLNNGTFSMSIQSNNNIVPSSERTVNQLVLSSSNPQLVLTTSTDHDFIEEDFIYLDGLSNSGGGLGALNKVFQVSSVTSNTITIEASQSTESISVTADDGDTTLAVVDSEGVYVGMAVSGTGIASNTTVTDVTDTLITISNATTQALSNVSITFTTVPGTYNSSDAGWSNGTVELSYDGIFINTNNYWFSNGLFAIGDGTKGLTWNGSALNVTGVINASEGGSMAGWSIGSDEIYKGTGSSKIALNAGSNPKIYIGSGFHASAGTGFYVDSTGKFSLSNLLTFSPSVDIPEASTTGTFNSGTNTITVASASGIVKGMTVLGTGIAPNSTVTNISGTTITTSKDAAANGTGVSLTFIIDDFSELQVNGRIKGVLESTSPISSPRIGTTATSITVSGDVGDQIATITTTGHAFITGEKILIENLPSTNGLNSLNTQFAIKEVVDSVTLIVSLPSTPTLNNLTTTGLNGSITLRELTMGLHPAQGTGSYSHLDGTGIRLDKFNWWFTNNQFRVGSVDSYIKWTTDPAPLLDVVGQIRATSGYIGGTNSGWEINEGVIKSSVETNTIILDAGIATGNPFISIGDETNPSFYVDSDGSLNIGSGTQSLTYNPTDGVTVEGTIKARSGFIGPDASTGWQFGSDGRLQSGEGDNTVVLVSAGAEFGGGSSTVKIDRVLVDDEYPETSQLLGSIYIQVDLANVNSSYLSLDPEVSQGFWDKYINFSFANNTSSTISGLLDGKRLIVQSVLNTSPFMAEGETFDANDEPITTVSASEQIDPAYVERSGTTLVFYTTEKLAGFTGYSSSFDLAAGQVVTIVADSEVASINSLNNTTATISSIDTSPTYDAEDETNYYKITMTTASSATLVRSSDFFNLNFYRALSSTQRTLVVYPEELALNVNSPNLQGHTSYTSVSTAATGAIAAKTVTVSSNSGILDRMSVIGTGVDPYSKVVGTPSSTLVNLSKSNTAAVNSTITFTSASITFYDSFAPGSSVNYYMWAGDQDPVSSSFSIVQNTSNSKIIVKADAGTTPIGTINMWVASSPPPGWIICNGSSITYSEYPELYVLLGGVSPFTATITVPDMRGRFPIGAGGTTSPSGTAIAATPKLTGGAIRYTYAATAAHTHTPGTFNASTNITEGTAVGNTDNHSHGVTGSTSANSANIGHYVPNSGTLVSFADNQHTHADGNLVTNSIPGTHNHNMNAFNASTNITEPATTGGTTAANATIDVYPPYYSVSFIIYTGRVV